MKPNNSPQEVERLLEHSDYVQSLARDLVRDSQSADDCAQDTWLQVLGNPVVGIESARGWLRRVLLRQAFRRGEESHRRRKREEQSVSPATSPSAVEVAGRDETRRVVVEELLALPEPYRAIILLRYFEGLTLREIAQRQAIPLETVRTRHRRGLAKLRETLTRRLRGHGTWAWLGLVALKWMSPEAGRVPEFAAAGFGLRGLAAVLVAMMLFLVVLPRRLRSSASQAEVPQQRQLRWRWTVLSAVGFIFGLPLGVLASGPLEMLVAMMLVTPLMFLVTGAILGTAQWFALRERLHHWKRWIPASATGLAIGLTVGSVLVEATWSWLTGRPLRMSSATPLQICVSVITIGTIAGACLGGAQWWSVRKSPATLSLAWIRATTLAFGASFALGFGCAEFLTGEGFTSPFGIAVFVLSTGTCVGILTGRALSQTAISLGPGVS